MRLCKHPCSSSDLLVIHSFIYLHQYRTTVFFYSLGYFFLLRLYQMWPRGVPSGGFLCPFNVLLLVFDFSLCTATCSRLTSFFSCSSPGCSYFHRECCFVLCLFTYFKVENDLLKPKSEHRIFSLLLTCHSSQALVHKISVCMWHIHDVYVCMAVCVFLRVCIFYIRLHTYTSVLLYLFIYIENHDSTQVFLILFYSGRIHSGFFPFPLCYSILPQWEYWLSLFLWHTFIWWISRYVAYLLQPSLDASYPHTQCWHLPGVCLHSAMEWICVCPLKIPMLEP